MSSSLDLREGFAAAMNEDCVVVIDGFDRLLDPATGLPDKWFTDLIRDLGDRPSTRGRILLVTNERLPDGSWLENATVKNVAAPEDDQAAAFLGSLLSDQGLENEVSPADRIGVARWLGGNRRAIQVFVSCLIDEPFDELINIDRESWDLPDQAVSEELVKQLEKRLLERTLERLDEKSNNLLQMLSVYRKPFTKEAISSVSSMGSGEVETSREQLLKRFLLRRDKKWYSLNPIAREVGRSHLGLKSRREKMAHNRASDHFTRHFRAQDSRQVLAHGPDLVEARYHLFRAGRQDEFDDIAKPFKKVLLATYRNASRLPAEREQIEEIAATLMSALADNDSGYSRLRDYMARVLLVRGRKDDDRIALRQLTMSTRESADSSRIDAWRLRIQLAARLEGPRAVEAAVSQGAAVIDISSRYMLFLYAGNALYRNGHATSALSILEQGTSQVSPESRYGLYTLSAFICCAERRRKDAIHILGEGYQGLAPDHGANKLLEEALFIALGTRDADSIMTIRSQIVDSVSAFPQRILCDMLVEQTKHRFIEAAQLAESYPNYHTLVGQAAYCWLCAGEPAKALNAISSSKFPNNPISWWLRGLVFYCNDQIDRAREEFSKFGVEEYGLDDRPLWLRIWDDIPDRVRPHPTFYFPYLPQSLTGLTHDLRRIHSDNSIFESTDWSAIRLPMVEAAQSTPSPEVASRPQGEGYRNNIYLRIDNQGERSMTASYNNYGQVGAMGDSASSNDNVFNFASTNSSELVAELQKLRLEMRKTGTDIEHDEATLEVGKAIEAADKGDEPATLSHLAAAGKWALGVATGIGTALAAAAIRGSLGI